MEIECEKENNNNWKVIIIWLWYEWGYDWVFTGLVQSWAAIVMGIVSGSIPWVSMMVLHKKSSLLQKVINLINKLFTYTHSFDINLWVLLLSFLVVVFSSLWYAHDKHCAIETWQKYSLLCLLLCSHHFLPCGSKGR